MQIFMSDCQFIFYIYFILAFDSATCASLSTDAYCYKVT